jgi:hypothetical protein
MTDPVHKLLDSADLEPATERAYLTDWRAFTTWGDQRGRQTLPADPALILLRSEQRGPHAPARASRSDEVESGTLT